MITVFGASGGIGTHLVTQALAAGHDVTAVVRGDLPVAAHPRLKVVQADVMSPDEITPAVDGAEAVFSALGPRDSKPTTVCSDGVFSIITAMEKTGATRLLAVSAAGAYGSPSDGLLMRTVLRPALQYALRHVFADLRIMEDLIHDSDLTWTVVRPPRLTNAPRSPYRTALDTDLPKARSIPRSSAAHALLALAPTAAAHHATATIAT